MVDWMIAELPFEKALQGRPGKVLREYGRTEWLEKAERLRKGDKAVAAGRDAAELGVVVYPPAPSAVAVLVLDRHGVRPTPVRVPEWSR